MMADNTGNQGANTGADAALNDTHAYSNRCRHGRQVRQAEMMQLAEIPQRHINLISKF